eukprot:gene5558-5613_t
MAKSEPGACADFLHHRVGVGLADAGNAGQGLAEEASVGGHVGDADLQQIVETAGDHVAFLDFGNGADGLAELVEVFGGDAVERDFDEGGKSEADFGGVEKGGVAGDDASGFEVAHPFGAGGAAEPDVTGKG